MLKAKCDDLNIYFREEKLDNARRLFTQSRAKHQMSFEKGRCRNYHLGTSCVSQQNVPAFLPKSNSDKGG